MVSPAPDSSRRDSVGEDLAPVTSRIPLLEHDDSQVDTGDEAQNQEIQGHTNSDVKTRNYLYCSHFLSTWNSRVFEFAAILFLAKIFPGTLLPTSVYALVRAAAAIVLSPSLGNYIDRSERLHVVRISVVGQRVAVVLSCVLFTLLATNLLESNGPRNIVLLALCVLAPIEKLCSIMNLIAVERDWVVVIAENTSQDLKALNSQMRRIDLFCKLLGPLFIALVDGASTLAAIILIFATNLVSVVIEYFTIARVYHRLPVLANVRNPDLDEAEVGVHATIIGRCRYQLRKWREGLRCYVSHQAFLASLALSFLYLTVLSFSGQMVAFLLSSGFASTKIGLMRTAAVVLELSATWLAPVLMKRIGPVRSGLWSINWQLCCIVPAVAVFWIWKGSQLSVLIMILGVILSRVGLWGFDLSVQIVVQESVDSEARGSFSSTEASAQNLFELFAYASTIIFQRPDQFRYPILLSAGAIVIAACLYAQFVRNTRGHLLHMSKCVGGKGFTSARHERGGRDIRLQGLP